MKVIKQIDRDQAFLAIVRTDPDAFKVIYKTCKNNCKWFLMTRYGNRITYEDFEEIYDDACTILYEKILDEEFIFTSTFQTYLNSVCLNLLRNEHRKQPKNINIEEFNNVDSDCLPDSGSQNESKEVLFDLVDRALEELKKTKHKCYQLIIYFYYHKLKLDDITIKLGFSSVDSTKTQKSKCIKAAREMAFKCLIS